jgi:acetyl esterase/lipase
MEGGIPPVCFAVSIPGLAAGQPSIPIRIYTPPSTVATAPYPVMVWLHGGSWFEGSIATHDIFLRQCVPSRLLFLISYHGL